MKNDITLQNNKPVDENLRPVLVGDKETSLELAEKNNKARIAGDLQITGDLENTGQIDQVSTEIIKDGPSGNGLNRSTTGSITLESESGDFVFKKSGNEFSSENSAYAGMILGSTKIQNAQTGASDSIITIGTSMTVLQTVQGTAVRINFVAPPSGNVEIEFRAYLAGSSKTVYFSLSDNSSYNEVNQLYTYDQGAHAMDETDRNIVTIPFVVTGLTAGTGYAYYIAAESSTASSYIYHGTFRATGKHYPPILIKAIALPETILTGE